MSQERRFSDEEFALIVRRASEMRDERPGRSAEGEPTRTDGMSLAEIQAIAKEVGLDPEKIARAANTIPSDATRGRGGLLGSPVRRRYESRVEGEMTEDDMRRVVNTLRREFASQGVVNHVLGDLQWSGQLGLTRVQVNVSARDGKTEIDMTADRSAASILGTVFPALGWFIGVVAIGEAVGVGTLIGVTLLIVAVGGAVATARGIWAYNTPEIEGRLRSAMEAVADEIATAQARRKQKRLGASAKDEGSERAEGGEPADASARTLQPPGAD